MLAARRADNEKGTCIFLLASSGLLTHVLGAIVEAARVNSGAGTGCTDYDFATGY